MFVTNLAPCTGVRLHLWPEKRKSASELPGNKRVLEVTSRMVHIPSGPAPRQVRDVASLKIFMGVHMFILNLVSSYLLFEKLSILCISYV